MIKYHISEKGIKLAEIIPEQGPIQDPLEMLDLMVEAGYNSCDRIIMHADNLHPDFFDLRTGIAGEILQKFSNYRMKLSLIGDFSGYKSKSLQDFIRESNSQGIISFVDSIEKALA